MQSKFSRVLWNINGVFLSLIFILGIIVILEQNWHKFSDSNYKYNKGLVLGKKKNIADSLEIDLQHLNYDAPEYIPFSDYMLSPVRILDKDIPKEFFDNTGIFWGF